MKEIGVVRKIDELGRIVIPKEIRKTLGIKEGENLEIFIDNNSVCLQKYSSLLNLKKWASYVVDICKRHLDINLIVMDRDKVITAFDDRILEQGYTSMLLEKLNNREKYISYANEEIFKNLYGYYYFVPLILEGDLFGCVILFSEKEIDNFSFKIVDFVIQILSKDIC